VNRRAHPSSTPAGVSRRALLERAGVVGAAWAGFQLAGCSDGSTSEPDRTGTSTSASSTASSAVGGAGPEQPSTASSSVGSSPVLLAYFSRAGENYFNGGRTFLDVGNTQVVTEMIEAAVPVDVYRIEAVEPYSDSYDETVERNVREQDSDARPAIASRLPAIDGYDTVLLGSGIWNVRPPMIMSTFLDAVDLTGKRLVPFVTYAVSGLGRKIDVYTDLEPGATIGEGLAVRGEDAADAGDEVNAWCAASACCRAELDGVAHA
jgi:flavodoxin